MAHYKWHIENVIRIVADGGVYEAHWVCAIFETPYQESMSGVVQFSPNAGTDGFTPYSDLTEAQVLGWIYREIDKDEIETNLAAALAERITPTTSVGLPWGSNE